MDALQKKLEARKQALQAHKMEAQHVEAERKSLDLDAQSKRQQIAKSKTQQMQTRKNEEFAALEHTIAHLEAEISTTEDKELDLMERYENAQRAVADETVLFQEFEKTVLHQIETVKQRTENAQKEKASLQASREPFLAGISAAVLDRYQRLLKSKGGRAIVPVLQGSSCGGCHMEIPSQTVIDAKTGAKMVACENCGRFIYWQE